MGAIEIQLLGRFSVRREDEEIPPASFRGRLVRTLVRILLTRRGAFVSQDTLAEALWPERMPADPATNLRVLVGRARAALGDPALIVTGPGGYSFAAGEGAVVDTEVFAAAVAAGADHLAAGRAAPALREFRSALEVWRGEPLAEDAYEDWAREPRARLRRAHLQALEGGAEAALTVRDPAQAVALAEQAVTLEPLREAPALLLARALAASGDQVGALRAIDSLRRRLGDEVGLDLSPEALALETRLQRGEAVAAPGRRPVPAPGRQAFEGLAFVGRDAEIETLLAAAGSPEPGAVLVAGSPGAGKSRLLAEAAARSELPVLSVRAFLPERNEPWSLARGLLREALDLDLAAAAAVPDRAASALADVVPELEELRPVTGVTVDPESRRALALEAAARVMAAATGKGALVIADDLQWADPTSLAVLGLVARRVPNAALVLAYRTEEVTSESPAYTFIDELFSMRASVVELAVGPLAVEAIAAVLTDAELVAAIAEETDRTPLAVIEAVRGLAAEGVIEPDARGTWAPCRAGAAARAREVARSGQRRAIQARARRQSPSRRQLLALLSLLGREAPARVLVRATGAAEARILEDLDALARGALARLGDAGWATAHDLVGEAVAEGLARADRGRFHHLLARALGEEAGDPAEIARHLAGAGDREAAAAAFSQAARQRLEQFAGAEARQLAEAGLALEPRGETLGALLRIRGEARAIRGDPAGARDDLHAALPSLPRGADRSRALVRIAELTWVVDSAQAGVLVEMALAEAGSDREARAEALTVAANFDANDNEIGRAEERASEALALFEDLGEPAGLASVTDLRAIVAFFRGQLVEAGELYERAARLYRASGRLLKVGNPWGMRAWTLLFAGHPREALAEIEGALELERSLGQTEGELFCRWLRGEILCTLGPLDEARRDLDAALAGCRELGHRELVATTLRALALWHLASGDLEGAEEAAREAIEPGAGLAAHPAHNSACLASVLVERGALDEAETAATEAVRSGMGIPGFDGSLVLAEVALARGDPDGERLAAEALAATEASGYLNSRTRQRLEARVPEWRGLLSAPVRRREQRVFMFTDIVSSTNLVEMVGDEAWDHLLRWHDQTLRALFSEHRGEEVNRIGDGFFVAFESAADAVGCASAIQRDLARHRAEHGFAPQVRIGLHAAEATREGADYQGRGVHEAARISGTAAGGEIVASLAVVEGLPELDVSEPRPVSLKGLSEPIDVVSISWS